MLYDRIALDRHDYAAIRAERSQNAKHWVLRLNAKGLQKPLRHRQEFADALKQCLENARCSPGGDGTNSDHNINSVHDKISNSEEEKTSITMSIARLDGGVTEGHGETRRQHLHLQLRNGKRVGAPWQPTSYEKWFPGKNLRKSTGRGGQDTHSRHTSVQYSVFTSAERIARAWLKNCITSLCA